MFLNVPQQYILLICSMIMQKLYQKICKVWQLGGVRRQISLISELQSLSGEKQIRPLVITAASTTRAGALCILEKKLKPFQIAEGNPKLMAMNFNRPDLGLFIFNMGIFEEQKLFYGGKCLSCKKCKMDGVVFVIYLFCATPTLIST